MNKKLSHKFHVLTIYFTNKTCVTDGINTYTVEHITKLLTLHPLG